MAWIRIPDATLPGVLAVQAGDPTLLRTHLAFYRHIMFAPSPLSRRERELVAVAVSAENRCHY
jgi:alkylhydroperoxidase family enzyme